MTETTGSAVFRDPARSVGDRVDDLLARMSLDEKLAQLGSQWVLSLLSDDEFSETKAAQLLGNGIGHITRPAGATTMRSVEVARTVNAIQRYLVTKTRLGVPAVMHEESLHGYLATESVVYPQAVGMAATWNPSLVEKASAAIGRHLRALGARHTLSPVLDLGTDPRWGRIEETLGEDPLLVAEIASAAIRGLQGAGVTATAKHFVGHGSPEGGRNRGPVHFGPRELRDEQLYPFEVAVRRDGVGSVMHAYNDLDGVPAVANRWLLTEVLREQWGFDGVVVSDYSGVDELVTSHATVPTFVQAAAQALEAGVDVELPATTAYGDPLRSALETGLVTTADVNRAVRRLLTMKMRAGLFENPYVDEPTDADIDLAGQRDLAGTLAEQSIVLLTNPDGVLPLGQPASIAVVGPLADSYRDLLGGYAHLPHIQSLIEMRDQANVFELPVPSDLSLSEDDLAGPTVLSQIRAAFPGSDVRYARGCELTGTDDAGLPEAVALARDADVAIVAIGDRSGLTDDCTTGEARDRLNLGPNGLQEQLVERVIATGTSTVVVSVSGRPPTLPFAAEHAAALVHAWVPGQEGGRAIARVLSGAVNPSGRLPMTVLRDAGQIPLTYRHKPSGGRSHWKGDYVDGPVAPLFPFGHGLSYTTFDLSDLQIAATQVATDGVVDLTCLLSNSGGREGTETVQLYVRDHEASVTRPVKELISWARVRLEPGQRARVRFAVPAPFLSFTGRDMVRCVEPGGHTFGIGRSSGDLPLQADVELVGRTEIVANRPSHTPRASWDLVQ